MNIHNYFDAEMKIEITAFWQDDKKDYFIQAILPERESDDRRNLQLLKIKILPPSFEDEKQKEDFIKRLQKPDQTGFVNIRYPLFETIFHQQPFYDKYLTIPYDDIVFTQNRGLQIPEGELKKMRKPELEELKELFISQLSRIDTAIDASIAGERMLQQMNDRKANIANKVAGRS